MTVLDNTDALRDLSELRSNQPEPLHGDRTSQHSIRINDQWQICFRWIDEGPCYVEIMDYN